MRGVLSIDIILSGIVLLSMYMIAGGFAERAMIWAEEYLTKPSCLLIANDVAYSLAYADRAFGNDPKFNVYPNDFPTGFSIAVYPSDVNVTVSGETNNFSCEVRIP